MMQAHNEAAGWKVLEKVAALSAHSFGKRFLAGYAMGSLARGGFSPRVSDVDYRWDGDTMHFSFRALGRRIEGTGVVSAGEVVFDIGLPLMARPFEGQIRSRIIQALDDLLG